MHQHDTVKAFIDDYLVKTGGVEDFIQRSDMYRSYCDSFPEEKNKKTSLGKKRFWEQFQMHMGTDGYFERKRKRGGRYKELYEGWSFVSTE